MAKTRYENKKLGPAKLAVIEQANAICEDYAGQGLVLTLRQLYYQFVARGLVDNEQREYDRLGDVCKDARMAGLMDWNHLIDRTRNLQSWKSYRGPQQALQELAKGYHRDVWAPQKKRVEVWIEKDAAIGVVEGVCHANRIPYFSCRGYTSVSEMHAAAQRIRWHIENGEQVTILHIGDHDPSGLDMSRDIEARLRMFMTVDWRGLHNPFILTRRDINASMRDVMRENGSQIRDHDSPFSFKRIALNHDQVLRYAPPPNPVKKTDARFQRYFEETGLDQSWELDALDPSVLQNLIQVEVDKLRDDDAWADEDFKMETERTALVGIGNWWDDVTTFVTKKGENR